MCLQLFTGHTLGAFFGWEVCCVFAPVKRQWLRVDEGYRQDVERLRFLVLPLEAMDKNAG